MNEFSRTTLTVSTLFILVMAATPGHAQETMLGVHGGSTQSSSPGSVSTVNQTNAKVTIIGTPMPGIGITGVATNSSGRIFASTGSLEATENGPRLIEIDPATGEMLNDVGRLQTAAGDDCFIGDLSFQPGTDTLFGVAGNVGESPRCSQDGNPGGTLVTIDTATAEVTVIGRDEDLSNSNGGIAFAADGTLYFTPCWSADSILLTIDPATANILTTTALENDTCYMGLAVRPSDGTLFASFNWVNRNSSEFVLVTLNPSTGVATLVGDTAPEMIHDLTFTDAIGAAFVINAAISDAWFFPATSGQGFFIIVWEDSKLVFLSWFTYETERPPEDVTAFLGESGHRWVTALGPYEGDTAVLDVFLSKRHDL